MFVIRERIYGHPVLHEKVTNESKISFQLNLLSLCQELTAKCVIYIKPSRTRK